MLTDKDETGACTVQLPRRRHLKTTRGQRHAALREIEDWNSRTPVGAEVCVHRDNGEKVRTRTLSEAKLLCGSAVAWFENISGAYALDHAHALAERSNG